MFHHKVNLPKPIFVFLLIFFLCGCGQDITDMAKSITNKEEYAAPAPKVEEELSSLMSMDKNSERKKALETAHKDWLKLRTSHCASQISQQDKKDDRKLQECYEAFDNQRIDFIKQQKIKLLYESPCQGEIIKNNYRVTYPQEKGYTRGIPRSVVAASRAPVVAVTFANDMTEIYDIVNGQLINRIKTLDTKDRSVGYNFFLSPNGRILICSFFMPKSELMMWDVMTGELLRYVTINLGNKLITSDGRYFIYSERNKLCIYDIVTGEVIWNIEGKDWSTYSMALSPDEKYLIAVRGQNIECWELFKTSDGKLSMNIRTMEPLQNYHPTSMVFAQDSQSFYSILYPLKVVERRVFDLKEMNRYSFPQFQNFSLKNIYKTDVLLMEVYLSSNTINAFYVDMTRKTAYKIIEHVDNYTKLAPLSNGQMILAGVNGLKTLNVPDKNEFAAFGGSIGNVVVENVYVDAMIKDTVKDFVKIEKPSQPDCESIRTEAVGVYEGTLPNNRTRGFQERIAGYVDVNIGPTDKPVKLVLSSYEPVIWRLHLTSNANLSEIYLSGSNDSRVEGVDDITITFIGKEFAYNDSYSRGYRHGSRSRNDSSTLSSAVKQKTGCPIDKFQGTYKGSMFYIGRVTKGVSEVKDVYKTVDEKGNVVFSNN